MDNVEQSATNHPAVGPAMKAEFPEVKDFVRFVSITLFINAPTVTYKSPNGSVRSYNETVYSLLILHFSHVFVPAYFWGPE
jgi:putative ABC transport system permease protein